MPKAYSFNLRWRILWQKLLYQKTDEQVAADLFVCPRTVQRVYSLFLATGDVQSQQTGRPKDSTSLFPHEEYFIVDLLFRRPTIQLAELGEELVSAFGTRLSLKCLFSTLKHLGFTRKKVSDPHANIRKAVLKG